MAKIKEAAEQSNDSFDQELARVDKDHADKLLSEDLTLDQRAFAKADGNESVDESNKGMAESENSGFGAPRDKIQPEEN